jgi:hypothetical protein
MIPVELLHLRDRLTTQRHSLLGRLAADTVDMIEPGFLRLLADTHTAIAAVDAALAESAITGDAP